MKRVLSLLLSAVMAASAALTVFASTPGAGSRASTEYVFHENFDKRSGTVIKPNTETKFGVLRVVPKQFASSIEMDGTNGFLRLGHENYTGSGDADSYFDLFFWGSHQAKMSEHPYYRNSFAISYDVNFRKFDSSDAFAFWDAAVLRLRDTNNGIKKTDNAFRFKRNVPKNGKGLGNIILTSGKDATYKELNTNISLDRWYNVTVVFDVPGREMSLYLDGVLQGTMKAPYQWSDEDTGTWLTCGWGKVTARKSGKTVSYDASADVDNIRFYQVDPAALTPENVLNAGVIESIPDSVMIECTAYHAQPEKAAAAFRLKPDTYTFMTTSPTTAVVTLTSPEAYYSGLGGEHTKKGAGDPQTAVSLKYENGAWTLDTPAHLYVTCDAAAPVDYTVTYLDGCDGRAFAAQTYRVTKEYDQPDPATPLFAGAPQRQGYQFLGWSPMVEKTVTHDAVYTAVWKEIVVFRPALGSARLTVTDEDGNPVAGAKFELHRVASSGADTVLDTFTTDRNGLIKLYANPKVNTGLSPNSSYYWKQIEAPDGYRIARENLSFAARYGSTAKLTVVNGRN